MQDNQLSEQLNLFMYYVLLVNVRYTAVVYKSSVADIIIFPNRAWYDFSLYYSSVHM